MKKLRAISLNLIYYPVAALCGIICAILILVANISAQYSWVCSEDTKNCFDFLATLNLNLPDFRKLL